MPPPPGLFQRISFYTLLGVACGLAPSLRADVVFSSLNVFTNNGPGIIGSDFSAQGPQELATAFTPGANYTFTSAEVGIGGVASTGSVDVSIYSNSSSNLPGASLDSVGSITDIASSGLYTVDSVSNSFTLHAGVEYWLVLTPGTSSTYVASQSGDLSSGPPLAVNFQGSGWTPNDSYDVQFQINGNPVASTATPEPATLWLAFPALAAIGLVRTRYSRQ